MKFRIALLVDATNLNGSVTHTIELAESLHALGHDVCLYALGKDGRGFDRVLACEVKLIPAPPCLPKPETLLRQRIHEFVDYLQAETLNYDFYHAQDCISANALAILRQQKRIPHFIRTVHYIESYQNPYLRQCQDRSIREADLCLCVSEMWRIVLQKQYRIQALRVVNGINTQRFSSVPHPTDPQVQERLGLTGAPIFLTVGGIESRKNAMMLIRAFAEVLITHPNAQLVIAGGAALSEHKAYRSEFFALAENLGIAPHRSLNILGVVSNHELSALYRSADAFVFPSVREGWGLVILEAIASGLPIVASDHAPFTEFLSPNQALLVNPKSSEAIAQAMRVVLEPEFAKVLVEQSQSILAQYTWEASAQMHANHYQTFLMHSRNSSPNPIARWVAKHSLLTFSNYEKIFQHSQRV